MGIGFFVPERDPTVNGFGPDGHEIRVYVPAYYDDRDGTPRYEVTDMTIEMSLWVERVPDATQVGRLMEAHENVLISSEWGVGDYVVDLDTGEVVPDSRASQ